VNSSLVVAIINSYTLKITVTIAPVTSHTKSSNSSSGHTALPLELRNSSPVNSHFRILSYPLGTDHAQKSQFYCCFAQTTQKTSHVMITSPVHWLPDCCLAINYIQSSYCCVTLSEVLIALLPSCFFLKAVQPQLGPWPTSMKLSVSLQFSRSWTFGRTPWAGDQLVARPLPVHKHRKTHIHKH
jgi:hypothetical protein